jgi:LmbE family N-acetylglucosaminyl deacetylase
VPAHPCYVSSVARTLLAVHAHPDDETIATGGTLARYCAEGVRTTVVTCTRGELGEGADADMGALRQGELEAAAQVLGVGRLVGLGYGDSGMPNSPTNYRPGAFFAANLDEAAARLLEIIHEEQPQVVVTYDETGGYGHPDHVKAHQVTLAACAQARVPKLYFIRIPLGWSRRFVAALRAAGIDAPGSAPTGADAGPAVNEVGVPDEQVTTLLDVRAYVEVKRQALACHRSQMPPEHFLMRMPPDLAASLWAHEFFSRAAGPTSARPGAIETDLFDGLS